MNPVASVFVLVGALTALLAAVGLLRFSSPYARFHAAGKASPVAFVIVSVGVAIELGWDGLRLLVAAVALFMTLPFAVHLVFRAVHRAGAARPGVDELGPVVGEPNADPSE
jgi:multicomponent Na+:H+ antiporter subunit G